VVLKKALQRVFSWARWAESLDFNQNKRSVFLKLGKALAVLALRQKAVKHWHHAGVTALTLRWACLNAPKSMKRHRKIYEK
jgi:hypothetical protein